MENIKFRAYIKDEKSSSYGEIVDVEWIDFKNKVITFNSIRFATFGLVEQVNDGGFELLQFTGLIDKKGREIYVGDLVTRSEVEAKDEEWAASEVVLEDGMFCFKDDYPNHLGLYCNFEVIGNIYQTPHLENKFK